MFKLTRTIAGFVAVTAVGGAGAAGVAMPAAAEAAACRQYEIPSSFKIEHSHGWTAETGKKSGKFKWQVSAWPDPRVYTNFGTLKLNRFDTSPGKKGERPKVEFTVTLSNGSAGVYKGKVNRDYFITGTTNDEFHRVRLIVNNRAY